MVKLTNRKYLLSIKVINFLTKSDEFEHKIRAIRKCQPIQTLYSNKITGYPNPNCDNPNNLLDTIILLGYNVRIGCKCSHALHWECKQMTAIK